MVFILSSSPNLIFDLVKQQLGITKIYSNNLEYINGKFTGRLKGTDCFGINKKKIVISTAVKYKISLENSFSYSDHHSDIPMLSVVGNPVAVSPNLLLKEYAERMNWKIEKWR